MRSVLPLPLGEVARRSRDGEGWRAVLSIKLTIDNGQLSIFVAIARPLAAVAPEHEVRGSALGVQSPATRLLLEEKLSAKLTDEVLVAKQQ